MSRGINKVILIGNLGADPEVRQTDGGTPVANLRLATNEQFRNKDNETQSRTEWHRLVVFGRRAEVAAEFLKSGSEVYIEGRLQTRKWTDKDGEERVSTEIVVTDLAMLGGRRGNGAAETEQPPRGRTSSGKGNGKPKGQAARAEAFDDDIPF